jgi:hypothetical protein
MKESMKDWMNEMIFDEFGLILDFSARFSCHGKVF